MKIKKLLILGLVASLSLIPALSLGATPVAADTIDEISASIDAYQEQKADLLGQIDDLQAQLVTTIAAQNDLAAEEALLEEQMAQTEVDLAEALEEKQIQHDAMKARIQYVYEKGGNDGWVRVFLEDGDINAWLNANEYTDNLYQYDRDQLQAYADAVTRVSELQTQQQQQKSELEAKKTSLKESEDRLNELLAQAQDEYDDYEGKIAEAYDMVTAYQTLVTAQNAAISELISAQQIASAETGVTDNTAYSAADTATADTYISDTTYDTGYVDTTTEDAQAAINEAAQQIAQETGTDISSATEAAKQAYQMTGSNGTASGSALLSYAQQFLGNSYVYGGNSLENGIDCSGFVQQVYANFGISTSRTSWDIETEGTEVSYSDVQIGDVVCYNGHVGIYAGDGQIINAANEEQGITYTPADYDEITSVRRFLEE